MTQDPVASLRTQLFDALIEKEALAARLADIQLRITALRNVLEGVNLLVDLARAKQAQAEQPGTEAN